MKIQPIQNIKPANTHPVFKKTQKHKEPEYIPLIFTGKYEHPDDSRLDYLV